MFWPFLSHSSPRPPWIPSNLKTIFPLTISLVRSYFSSHASMRIWHPASKQIGLTKSSASKKLSTPTQWSVFMFLCLPSLDWCIFILPRENKCCWVAKNVLHKYFFICSRVGSLDSFSNHCCKTQQCLQVNLAFLMTEVGFFPGFSYTLPARISQIRKSACQKLFKSQTLQLRFFVERLTFQSGWSSVG